MSDATTTRYRLTDKQAVGLLIGYFVLRLVVNRVGIAYLPRMLDSSPWAIPLLNNTQLLLIAAGTEARASLGLQFATGAASMFQSLVAGLILYWAGARFGPMLAERSSEAGSMWAAIWNPRQVARAGRWLDKRGIWAVAIARTIEWLVTPVVLVAGSTRMHFRRFLGAYTVGSAAFAGLTLWIGAMAGERWPWLPDRIKAFSDWSLRIAIGLLIFAVLAMVLASRLDPEKAKAQTDSETTEPDQGSTASSPSTDTPS